jgi:uncharacterized protein YjhX (UPF0386 family)
MKEYLPRGEEMKQISSIENNKRLQKIIKQLKKYIAKEIKAAAREGYQSVEVDIDKFNRLQEKAIAQEIVDWLYNLGYKAELHTKEEYDFLIDLKFSITVLQINWD